MSENRSRSTINIQVAARPTHTRMGPRRCSRRRRIRRLPAPMTRLAAGAPRTALSTRRATGIARSSIGMSRTTLSTRRATGTARSNTGPYERGGAAPTWAPRRLAPICRTGQITIPHCGLVSHAIDTGCGFPPLAQGRRHGYSPPARRRAHAFRDGSHRVLQSRGQHTGSRCSARLGRDLQR